MKCADCNKEILATNEAYSALRLNRSYYGPPGDPLNSVKELVNVCAECKLFELESEVLSLIRTKENIDSKIDRAHCEVEIHKQRMERVNK